MARDDDVLPPGLYEAVFTQRSADTTSPDLVQGDWIMRCEERTLDDIRALGGNDAADDRRFATVAQMSEANLALYRTFAQPFVRALATAPLAEWLHRLHPMRLQYGYDVGRQSGYGDVVAHDRMGARASPARERR